MNHTTAQHWLQCLVLALMVNVSLVASWDNSMMQTFEFADTTLIDFATYPYGDGTSPIWYTFQTFTFVTSATDSGFISFTASLVGDGGTEPQGVLALSLDGTILGTNWSATDAWGISKFQIPPTLFTTPSTGWSAGTTIQWPLATALLPAGTHTLTLLGSNAFDYTGYGWGLNAGAVMTFIGFPNSTITN